ncbi:MAG: hypothetical protein R3A79_03415 [Nannocystaceae bacterium]
MSTASGHREGGRGGQAWRGSRVEELRRDGRVSIRADGARCARIEKRGLGRSGRVGRGLNPDEKRREVVDAEEGRRGLPQERRIDARAFGGLRGGRGVDPERMPGDLDERVRVENPRLDRRTINIGAVGGSQIDDRHGAVGDAEAGVATGDIALLNDNVVIWLTTNQYLVLVECAYVGSLIGPHDLD